MAAKKVPKDPPPKCQVNVGCSVVLMNLGDGEISEYRVVSSAHPGHEADELSLCSPVGKALLGRVEGECVRVEVPRGTVTFRILRVVEADEGV